MKDEAERFIDDIKCISKSLRIHSNKEKQDLIGDQYSELKKLCLILFKMEIR